MTLRPRRQGSSTDDFRDPLNNFDAPVYQDELEKAIAEDTVRSMTLTPMRTVSPDTPVQDALKLMVEKDIACILVTDGPKLMGIFSERDVLTKLADHFEQVRHQPIRQFMTTEPVCGYETDSPATVINMMAVGGFRHVPILDMDDHVVGILGPRRVTRYLQEMIFRHSGD